MRRSPSLSVGERQRVEILKALYRDAKILILDEPTAVLTPAETDALFATLKLLVGQGLSIIFISHKLNEVMAVSDRVLVLRAGKLAGERVTAETNRSELAALMVGQEVAQAAGPAFRARPAAACPATRCRPPGAARASRSSASRFRCAAARSPALPAFPATARRRLPRCYAGTEVPVAGEIIVRGATGPRLVAALGPVDQASPASRRTATPSARSAT